MEPWFLEAACCKDLISTTMSEILSRFIGELGMAKAGGGEVIKCLWLLQLPCKFSCST